MPKTNIDIIILSYASNDELSQLTQTAVDTLLSSEDPAAINFNILVIESEKKKEPFTYPGTTTIYPDIPFSFNKYLNLGLKATSSEFICFCNNDLIFHKNWASEILSSMSNDSFITSASPFCPRSHPDNGFFENTGLHYGYRERKELAGWCIFAKRSLFDTIGIFDENIQFWYSDRDYALTLQKHKVKHCLVTTSKVTHLQEYTTIYMDDVTRKKLTSGQQIYFDYKWLHHNFSLYKRQRVAFNLHMWLIHFKKFSSKILKKIT